ncbi:unnamed protein product [Chrysoparadoxa australica]
MANATPECAAAYNEFADLFERKLWHQLTVAVYKFVSDETACKSADLTALYDGFIKNFEAKANQLKLAQIICAIARQCSDVKLALKLLEDALEQRERLGPEASLLLSSELGLYRLKKGDVESIKGMLSSGKEALEDLQAADTCVHSAHHLLASEYNKVVGPPEAFYKSALMYLAYTPLATIPPEQQYQLATDISLAALTGDGVFNFGEVLATPALKVLEGTPNAWLGSMLQAFNKGDLDAFNSIMADNRAAVQAQPAMVNREAFVKEKIALLCLMNMVFERPSHQRIIPFAKIAEGAKLPLDQVEWLIMRAMSLSLIKGIMDEVAQQLHVSWVQPRVLDTEQLTQLVDQLGAWKGSVGKALTYVEDQTPELLG